MESKKQWLENQKLIVSGWTSLSHLQIPSTKGLSHPSPHALKKKTTVQPSKYKKINSESSHDSYFHTFIEKNRIKFFLIKSLSFTLSL